MGRSRSTLVLFVAALGLGAYLYFVDSKRPVDDENAKIKVFSYDTEKISQIKIKSATGDVTELKKDPKGNWTIVAPAAVPADMNAVREVVTNLSTLEEDRVVDENAADLKTYGLAEPRIDITFNVDGEKEPKRILIGDKNPTNVGIYAKLQNGNRVFILPTSVETSLNRSTFDLRDKAALKFEQDQVTSVDLVSKSENIRLEKSGQDWKLVKPIQAPADFISVQGLIGQLQSAQMMALKDKPEDLKDLKQYGLDQPEVIATLGTAASKVTLELGGPADAAALWARDPSRPAVFSIGNGLAEELRKTPFNLRRKEIFDFRPFNTTRFEISRGKDVRAFERVKGTGENAVDTWKQVTPAAKTVDASNLEGALLEFSNLRAEAFVDQPGPTTGLSSPAAVIAVKFDDGKKEERITIGRVGENVFASRPDQPGAIKVEMGKFDAALKKLDEIK